MHVLRGLALALVAGGVAAVGLTSGGVPAPARVASAVLGPAYDASAASDVRALGIALQSLALTEGDLAAVTPAELAGWGWAGSRTTTATVWVDGDRFLVQARDVRPGASTLQVSSDDLVVRVLPADRAVPDAADGVLPVELVVVPARLPGATSVPGR